MRPRRWCANSRSGARPWTSARSWAVAATRQARRLQRFPEERISRFRADAAVGPIRRGFLFLRFLRSSPEAVVIQIVIPEEAAFPMTAILQTAILQTVIREAGDTLMIAIRETAIPMTAIRETAIPMTVTQTRATRIHRAVETTMSA